MKMANKMEMSLDDIIKSSKQTRNATSNKRERRGEVGQQRRNFPKFGGGRGATQKGRSFGGITRTYSRGDVNGSWKHDLFEGLTTNRMTGTRGAFGSVGATKLMISNLDFGVSDSDIQELFVEFGPLKSAAVHYDRSGRSLGTADVIYEHRGDAVKAMKQYNGVPLDGRAMSIQMTTSERPSPMRRIGQSDQKFQSRSPRNPRESGRPTFARNRSDGGRDRNPRNKRKAAPTAEELDAELDAYTNEMK